MTHASSRSPHLAGEGSAYLPRTADNIKVIVFIFRSMLCSSNVDVVVMWADGSMAGIFLTDGPSNLQILMSKQRLASSAPCRRLHWPATAAYSDILP